MSSDICILVFCGLPAAGKTTFVQKLNSFVIGNILNDVPNYDSDTLTESGECQCFCATTVTVTSSVHHPNNENQVEVWSSSKQVKLKHVFFDTIIPNDLYTSYRSTGIDCSQDDAKWKTYRNSIQLCVENDIQSVLLRSDESVRCSQVSGVIDDNPVYSDVSAIYQKIQWDGSTKCNGDPIFIFVIDDNMFYPSMRQSYYQLARKYNTGFAQVYLKCSKEYALEKNNGRMNAVPDHTIINMAAKIQPPDGSSSWEKYSLTLAAEAACQTQNMVSVLDLVLTAVADPVKSLPEVDEAIIEADRTICSENIVHQADRILRKIIGQEMGRTTPSESKEQRQKTALSLNECRKQLLDDLKSGTVALPSELKSSVVDSSTGTSSAFYDFVQQSFLSKMNSYSVKS